MPSEFRIWIRGENPNRNYAPVLFDDQAAEQVMASYREHGVDIQIDLEHLSLNEESRNYDPDARGWCELAIRDGELWAVNVRWTPDGERRLRERTQRYVSPTWKADENERPVRLFNIALCAQPATDHAMPLAAKTRNGPKGSPVKISSLHKIATRVRALKKANVDPQQIIKLLAEGDAPAGDSGGSVAGINIADLATFLEIDINPAEDPAGFVKAIGAKLDEIASKLRGEGGENKPAEPSPDAMPASEVAAAKLMTKMLGVDSCEAGALRLSAWREIVRTADEAAARVAKDAAAIELSERKAVVMRLQACGAETPATSGLNDGKLCKRLMDEPLEAMKARAETLELAKGSQSAGQTPGNGGNANATKQTFVVEGKAVELDARELAICAEQKCDPKTFAMLKSRRATRAA